MIVAAVISLVAFYFVTTAMFPNGAQLDIKAFATSHGRATPIDDKMTGSPSVIKMSSSSRIPSPRYSSGTIMSEALKYRFHMALFIDTYSEQYRLESSKSPSSNAEDIAKAKALVEEKLKAGTSTDNNAC